jgi:hypothetical protein
MDKPGTTYVVMAREHRVSSPLLKRPAFAHTTANFYQGACEVLAVSADCHTLLYRLLGKSCAYNEGPDLD